MRLACWHCLIWSLAQDCIQNLNRCSCSDKGFPVAYNSKSSTIFLISSLQHVSWCTLPHIDIALHELPSSQQARSTFVSQRHVYLAPAILIVNAWTPLQSVRLCHLRLTYTALLTLYSSIGVYETKLLQSVQPHTSLSLQLELQLLERKAQRHHLHLLSALLTA